MRKEDTTHWYSNFLFCLNVVAWISYLTPVDITEFDVVYSSNLMMSTQER